MNIHAVDFSDTRLKKATERLKKQKNVVLKKVDFLGKYDLDNDYDVIISQRFLINLMEWKLQKKVILDLLNHLKKTGILILLEGSQDGVSELNRFRKFLDLEPIPVKWHNLFFDDAKLKKFISDHKYKLIETDGIGEFFLLTRGIRPYFDKDLNWNSNFNKIAASKEMANYLKFGPKFSRLRLYVFAK